MHPLEKMSSSFLSLDQTYVFLVDEKNNTQGICEKLWVHKIGALHRAVSVYLTSTTFDNVLLQKRSSLKYHSPGRWSNAACTHTLEGESPEQAARRALQVELGLAVDTLTYLGYFIYKTTVGDDLIEHELDHVFVGKIDESTIIPFSSEEVDSIRWAPTNMVKEDLQKSPETFTYWFPYLMQYLESPESGVDYRK